MQWAADVCQSPFCMWIMREQFCCSDCRRIASSPANVPYGKAISCHNASSKMEIPTLLVFDLLIMHISRELVRRLLYGAHRNDVSKEADGLRQHSDVQSGRRTTKCGIGPVPLTLFRVTWSPFSRAIVVDRTSPSQMAQ